MKNIIESSSSIDWGMEKKIGTVSLLLEDRITTENVQPISTKPYRIAPVEADALREELDQFCRMDIIHPSIK